MKFLSRVRLFATPWTVAYEAPLSMGFPRQEYCSGLPFPAPGDLPDPGIKPVSPASLLHWQERRARCHRFDPMGLGRSPGEGNGNPLQYSCLRNPMDRGIWRATVHGVTKESDMTSCLNNNLHIWEETRKRGTKTDQKKKIKYLSRKGPTKKEEMEEKVRSLPKYIIS